MIIDWTAPYNGGTQLTSYTIEIRTADISVFEVEVNDCDGSQNQILIDTQCTVTIANLRLAPFNLAWGASIYAKVKATNYLGSSVFSDQGNGAIIRTYPLDPINLVNNV